MVPLEGGRSCFPRAATARRSRSSTRELDAEYARTMANMLGLAERDREATSADEMEAEGKYWYCTGPIEYDGAALQRDIARLKAALGGVDVADVFLPVVAPASTYWLRNEYYATEEEFVYALADALHEEYKGIVDAGFLVQVDDAVLCTSTTRSSRSAARWRTTAAGPSCASTRSSTRSRGSREERIRYHVCHGSWHGPHVFDPPLAEVIDLVLGCPRATT